MFGTGTCMSGWFTVFTFRGDMMYFPKHTTYTHVHVLFSLNVDFALANSAYPGEMSHSGSSMFA